MTREQFCNAGMDVLGGLTAEFALLQAIQRGNQLAAATALRAGCDIYCRLTSKKSFLRLAGEAGHRGICELLTRYGADPNETNGKRNHSLLHSAVVAKNYAFAAIVLDLGADPSPQSSSGATPLHFAARSGQQYLAARLIQKGADRGIQDNAGRTAFDLAVATGETDLAAFLDPGTSTSHPEPQPRW